MRAGAGSAGAGDDGIMGTSATTGAGAIGLPGGGGSGSDVTGSAGMAVTGSGAETGGVGREATVRPSPSLSDAQAASTNPQPIIEAISRDMRAVSSVIARSEFRWSRP
jgi:hypothetical protein